MKPVATAYFSYVPGEQHRSSEQIWSNSDISLILQGDYGHANGKRFTTFFAKKHLITHPTDKPNPNRTGRSKEREKAEVKTMTELRAKARRILTTRVGLPENQTDAKHGRKLLNKDEASNTFVVCNFYSPEELKNYFFAAVRENADWYTKKDEFHVDLWLKPRTVLTMSKGSIGHLVDGIVFKAARTGKANTFAIVHLVRSLNDSD